MRNFRNYTVREDGLALYTSIFKVTRQFPKEEVYGLTSQLRRAALSVPSNIAEGSSRSSPVEFSRFIEIATGSLFELETQLIAAHQLSYLKPIDLDILQEMISSLRKQLLGLRKKLKAA
ncbi:MAG: four helix bundle protein [Flavobacteriales bacterium]|nr:four helix bundle protein [Flavobacteriales bacterium]